jgi:hypothetical protein
VSHFARVVNSIVTEVIVAEQDFIDSGAYGQPEEWVQCSYNTKSGIHIDPTTTALTGRTGLRVNFPSVGWNYDANLDMFYPQKPEPFPSWILDTSIGKWVPPVPYPGGANGDGKFYSWVEETESWLEVTAPEHPEDVPHTNVH